MCDPKTLADRKKAYLTNWLSKAKSIQDAVPKVQQQLDVASWEALALSDAPDQVMRPIAGDLSNLLRQDLRIMQQVLPEIPSLDLAALNSSTAGTIATAVEIYKVTGQARRTDDLHMREWGAHHSQEYEILQGRMGRERNVRDLLLKLKRSLATEFDEACNAYHRAISGAGTQQNAGIAMRNVVEHYKGELIDRARKQPNEQKLKWEEMAERLVDNGMFRTRFIQQGDRWNDIQQRLSKLAKAHVEFDTNQLRRIFTEFVDHLYIVLSLVETGGQR